MTVFLEALSYVFTFEVLLTILAASALGVVLGAIPGLTAVMGVALLVPITFFMDPVPAISAIAALAAMAIFSGDIPGALLRIPGTPASAAYVDDAFAMTRAGQPERGLGLSMGAALVGGVMGILLLMFAAPLLARFATNFSSVEYFWLALLGLSCAAIVATGSALKGVLSLLFGLWVSFIGIDEVAGQARYTFGSYELMGGVSFIPAMIGMFALTEIIRNASRNHPPREAPPMGPVLTGLWSNLARRWKNLFRGGLTGALVGALPGAGADMAAWVAYAIAKRRSKTPEKFGKGHDEGLIEAGAANNGALSTAWVPTLVFGIPGDSITAIVIGVLYLKGLEPGPIIFVKTPELVYAIFIAFLLANLLLLPLGWMVIRISRHLLRVPQSLLMPIVLAACMVGSFAINNALFGVGVMLAFGFIGWLFEENGIPLAPAILGIVLGSMLEFNFVTSMLKSHGDPLIFVQRPIAAILALFVLAIWAAPVIGWIRRRKA
ncbi:tripartite tricarboxylate transporter permease [Ponticoccus alexandrii]|uniref:C4-dicarboxylate ABC transporter permease n=1 Tax=Ponticoccus alexandrii TaxID=1943633 RepID=A0ABX7FGA0_9RHOB|nr:tripartite tricarboxylate transporter permease [Ponticoccus alexandrii]KID12385.1 C4-dicarboxylate ABC transporter permease [Rhodobacteraceae bacterium PD-2]QRF69116.1 C4-dicarboxylate ABC transporter permease [Ponticoccus alexandrii]